MKRTNRAAVVLLLVAMGVAFYMMCAANPLRWDDLMYQYMWLDHRDSALLHPIDLGDRIDNFAEAFVSQCHHYMVMNGRFLVHLVTQCFCGFLDKPLFNVVNAFVYVLFLVLCMRFVGVRSACGAVLVVAGLWLGLPGQWVLSFDVVFSINYLWTATAVIGFLLVLRRALQGGLKATGWQNALLLLFGVVCGSLHEGFTLPVSGALFFYALLHRRSLGTSAVCLIVGMWVGTVLVAFSPATLGRASGASPESVQEFLARKLDVLRYSKRLYLLVAAIGASFFLLGRERTLRFVKDNGVALTIAVLGFLFLFVLPYYSQRMGFPTDLFVVLLLLRLVVAYPLWQRVRPYVAAVLLAALLVHVPLTVRTAQTVGQEYCEMLAEYEASPEGKTHFRNISVPRFCTTYIYRLGVPFEQNMISFTHGKEMVIDQ